MEQSDKQGEFVGRVGATFWPALGIIGFIVLVLCGLGLAVVAVTFLAGALCQWGALVLDTSPNTI